MSFAALIALVRGFMIAGILELPSFGLYATIVAIGMFLSALVSFGEIERTIKTFPRLWVVERYRRSIVDRADKSAWVMILRTATLFAFLVASTLADAIKLFAQMGMFVALIALSAALSSLYGSAIRASGDVELLARNTLFRALIVLAFGLLGANYFNWQGAILGEISGAMVGVLITRYSVLGKMTYPNVDDKHIRENESIPPSPDRGLWLFFAGFLASAPVYLDRAFVASVFGTAMVGTFGFLSLFVAGASTFTGIVAQRVGPELVKMQHLGAPIGAQIRYAMWWLALILVICIVGMAIVAFLLVFGSGQYFYNKFHLDLNLIFAVAVLCTLQIGVILDFVLISRNRESAVFVAACWYLFVFAIVIGLVPWIGLSLLNFIWLLALAKLIHIIGQLGFIMHIVFEHNHRFWRGR